MGVSNGTHRAKVDQKDGGPASHTEGESGGTEDDVASGGISGPPHGDDSSSDDGTERDVHGDPDTTT